MTYKRTDHFSCGHAYVILADTDLQIAKCPQCNIGEYDGSLVESDEKEERGARIDQQPNSFTERIEPIGHIEMNPNGTYGTSILQSENAPTVSSIWTNLWGASSSSANISPQSYESQFHPQTTNNGQILTTPMPTGLDLPSSILYEDDEPSEEWNGYRTEDEYRNCAVCQHEHERNRQIARDYIEQHYNDENGRVRTEP